jgi:hypothetical protein
MRVWDNFYINFLRKKIDPKIDRQSNHLKPIKFPMSKWKFTYGFPEPKSAPLCARRSISYISKIYGIDLKIKPDDSKLINAYNYTIGRLFSLTLKERNFEMIEYYLSIGVPTHFGKSLCVHFIHNQYPIELVGSLIANAEDPKAIISLIYHCGTNSYVGEFIWLLDKMVNRMPESKITYVYSAYSNFFDECIHHLISKKYYILLQAISSEFTNDSSKRGKRFFKNFLNYGFLLEDEFYHIVRMLAEIGESKTASELLNKCVCSLDTLNSLLSYSATTEENLMDQDNFRSYIRLLLAKGADYQKISLPTVIHRHVFSVIGEIIFKAKYDDSKLAREYLTSSTISKSFSNPETIDVFLSILHHLFFPGKILNIYAIMASGWSQMIHFLLNECDPEIEFVCNCPFLKTAKANFLLLFCRHDEILDLVLNNDRIGGRTIIGQESKYIICGMYKEAGLSICGSGLTKSLRILLNNETAKMEILQYAGILIDKACSESQFKIFDQLVAVPNLKFVQFANQSNQHYSLLCDQIRFRLWIVKQCIWDQYHLLELPIDPDAIKYICQTYLDIL